MRTLVRFVVVVAALVAVVLVLRFTVLRPDPVEVTVYRVGRGDVEETVTNSKAGSVETRLRAMLSPEVGGLVDELRVREGDRVKRDDVLMRLNDDNFAAEVRLQERTLATARAAEREACLAADQALRDYERYLRLQDDRIVSEELVEQLRSARDVASAACEAARARIDEAAAALALARVNRSKTVLRAPFDAVVAEVSTEIGEWITPSPPGVPIPAVIELIGPAEIYVSAPLDEVDVARVRTGLPVRVTLDAYPGKAFAGRVARVAPYVRNIEEYSRTFEIEVELMDAALARSLLPGTSADVEVILETRSDVLRVPTDSILEGGRVLIVNGDNRLEARGIEKGLANWAFTEVTGGLAAGDRIVTSLDREEVREEAKVVVVSGEPS